ncbi:MAG: sugar phosphate isomerase/epimerase [Verrucomicrobia bacterium]|nr:sugar phosphate isomerase/epimerase [Verrucomicrobiota bacterium]
MAAIIAAANTNVTAAEIPEQFKTGGFAIGCQAYSFNRYTAFEAIEKTAEAGGKVIEFYPGQRLSNDSDARVDHNTSDEVILKLMEQLDKFGVKAVNYGVVGIPNNEEAARKIFEFAKKMNMYAITTESVNAIDTIEKLVKEYDIRVGFHNHPRRPNDPSYKVWDPNYILSVVKDRDERIGAAADTGHWVRSQIKPIEAMKLLEGRIISLHMKDLNKFGDGAHDVPYGTGVSDIPAVLKLLQKQGFEGNISIEYEYDWEGSVPEIAQCIGFIRGFGAK